MADTESAIINVQQLQC